MPNAVKLAELVRRLRELPSFFALSFDAIALYAPDGTIVAGNHAACTLIGGRLRGAHFSKHVTPSQLTIVRPFFLSALEGRQPEFATIFVDTEGSERNVEVRLMPAIVDEETVGVIGFARDVTARDRADAAHEVVHAQLESLFAQNPNAISMIDANGCYIRINPAAEQWLGFPSAELAGRSVGSVAMELTPLQKIDLGTVVTAALRAREPTKLEVEAIAKDGARHVMALLAVPIVVGGETTGLFVIATDVTAEKTAREEVALLNLRGRDLYRLSSDITASADEQVKHVLTYGLTEFGYESAFAVSFDDGALTIGRGVGIPAPVDASDPLLERLVRQTMATPRMLEVGDAELRRMAAVNGTAAPFCRAFFGLPLDLVNGHSGTICFVAYAEKDALTFGDREILEGLGQLAGGAIKRSIEDARLRGLASFDTLTGLANRSLLAARFDRAIADAERAGEQIAVYYIDIDKFKDVNDTYGHHVGDEVLRAVGSRLERSCRRTDTLARIGGDEFVVLRPGPAIGTLAAELAERMRAALEATCNIEDLVLTFSVGIGIAIFPEDGEDQKTLLEHADDALYAGKAAGRGSIRRYASVRPLAITGLGATYADLAREAAHAKL